jgi:hypothetical protein
MATLFLRLNMPSVHALAVVPILTDQIESAVVAMMQ